MLYQKRKIGPFQYQRKWFALNYQISDFFKFITYRQYGNKKGIPGFIRRNFFTQLLDLSLTEEEILGGMKKNTSYEIRRSEKDGLSFEVESSIENFLIFFNDFAPSKKLSLLSLSQLVSLGDGLWVTKVVFEGNCLVMHAYLLDKDVSRGRLLYSATSVRTEESDRAVLGRANRALHWFDMISLKNQGICTYDFGGVALKDDDTATQGIDQFKLGFGGETVQEDNFDSPLLVLAQLVTGKGS